MTTVQGRKRWDDAKDRIEYHGTELVNAYQEGKCWHCGASTVWADTGFMAYLCSEECTDAKWAEYFEALTK
jgi:hypothetical protein